MSAPLTDHALSILGKKIGTTRVTAYDADKKPVGIFDVEVSYDISRLSAEIAHITGGGIRVSSVNGRIMLSGTVAGRRDARQGGPDRAAVRSRSDQHGSGDAAAADHAGGALHRSRPPGEPRTRRAVERVRQFDARQCRLRPAGVAAADHAAERRVSAAGLRRHRRRRRERQCRPRRRCRRWSPPACCPARRPSASWSASSTNRLQIAVNALETKGAARSLAEPNLVALSGDTASFLAGGEFPVPVPGSLGTVTIDYKKYGVGPGLHPDRAQRRPDQSEDQAGGQSSSTPAIRSPSPAFRCRR